MKIKHQTSKTTITGILCILAFVVVFMAIDSAVLIISLNNGMTINDFFVWVWESFVNNDFELKLIIIALILMPIIMTGVLMTEVMTRIRDNKKLNNDKLLKYINFVKNGITLVYKNPQYNKNILYSNIEKLSLTIETGITTGKYGSYDCVYGANIDITDNNGREHHVYYMPVKILNIYKIVCLTKYMKNFKYKFTGNGNDIKKKLTKNFLKIINNNYKITFGMYFAQSITTILIVIALLPFLFSIYFFVPAFTTPEEKTYTSHIEQGYTYFQNGMYNKALREYDKALNMDNQDHVLYYYRAIVYQKMRHYSKAIQEAENGIKYVNSKSTYFKVKNYKFMKDDIGLYTILAECYMELGEYEKAIDACNYVSKHVKYKYSDIYFKLGICNYHLNHKQKALEYFNKHRDIIQDYLYEQAATDYPAKYPTYTQNDLININQWIKSCNNN